MTARSCLLIPSKRATYDRGLQERLSAPPRILDDPANSPVPAPPKFDSTPQTVVEPTSDDSNSHRKRRASLGTVVGSAVALLVSIVAWRFLSTPRENQRPNDAASPAEAMMAAMSPEVTDEAAAHTEDVGASLPKLDESNDSEMTAVEEKPLTDSQPAKTPPPKKQPAPQKPKPKPSSPKKEAPKSQKPDNAELANLAFNAATNNNVADPDESVSGRARLAELSKRALAATRDCTAINKECGPLIARRQTLSAEIPPRQELMNGAKANMDRLDKGIALLQSRPIKYWNDPVTMQQNKLQEERNGYSKIYEANKTEIKTRVGKISAVNKSLQALEERMRKRWDELQDLRKQWLEICRPHDKYARADFESMQRVIDDWIRSDELWPDACCWGAIAAYELGQQQRAVELIEKADILCVGILKSKQASSQIDAAQGLIVLKVPDQRFKSTSLVQKAMTGVDRETDWQTHYIAGRAAAEIGRMDTKAKVYYERALKIDPNCQCAALWLGRLQTTSTEKTVRDVEAGTKLLESVWSNTGKRSWRVSAALARAYDVAGQTDEANKQRKATLKLAPENEREQLRLNEANKPTAIFSARRPCRRNE